MVSADMMIGIATSHISFIIILATVIVLYRFHGKAKKAGAMIWEQLGEGLLIAMTLVLLAQIVHVVNSYLPMGDVRLVLTLITTSAYLIASIVVVIYLARTVKDVREVMG